MSIGRCTAESLPDLISPIEVLELKKAVYRFWNDRANRLENEWQTLYGVFEFFAGTELDDVRCLDFNGVSGLRIAAFAGFTTGF